MNTYFIIYNYTIFKLNHVVIYYYFWGWYCYCCCYCITLLWLQGGYQYAIFAVGPYKYFHKYFRFFDFDRYPGQVSTRGWKVRILKSLLFGAGEYLSLHCPMKLSMTNICIQNISRQSVAEGNIESMPIVLDMRYTKDLHIVLLGRWIFLETLNPVMS